MNRQDQKFSIKEFFRSGFFRNNAIQEKIIGFRKIAKNQFYGNSELISEEAIGITLKMNDIAQGLHLDTNAISGLDGNIVLLVYYKNKSIEFNICNENSINYFIEVDNEEIGEDLILNSTQAIKKIYELKNEKVCDLSELSTETTGMKMPRNFNLQRSQEVKVFQFLAATV